MIPAINNTLQATSDDTAAGKHPLVPAFLSMAQCIMGDRALRAIGAIEQV
jgi:hypothetical protein